MLRGRILREDIRPGGGGVLAANNKKRIWASMEMRAYDTIDYGYIIKI